MRGVARGAQAAGEVDLVDVAGGDVFFDVADGLDEGVPAEGVVPCSEGEGGGVGVLGEGAGEGSGFPPLVGLMVVDEEFGVDAEGELSVVVNPAAGGSGGEAVVDGRGGGPGGEGGFEVSGVGNVAFDDFEGPRCDDGERRGVFGGEVAGGVEEDESGEVGEGACHFIGPGGEIDGSGDEAAGGLHDGSLTARGRLVRLGFLMKNSNRSRKPNLGVFHLSCWMMGLVAFVEVMTVGMAVALRRPEAPEPVERIVKEFVMVPAEARTAVMVTPPKPLPVVIAPIREADLVPELEAVAKVSAADVLNSAPPVLDPIVEGLLKEASDARIQGDLLLSHTKLKEAELQEPGNVVVLYSLGTNYEAFGHYDKARDYFTKVLGEGPAGGSLYEKAAIKITQGFEPEVKDLAMLGYGRMMNPQREKGGERRTLILPVEVSPSKDFDPMLFTARVRFFEEVDGRVGQAVIQPGDLGFDWVTGKADWADGEEMAEVWYFVPDQDAATGLLFGQRQFHGYVAELYYDGRLVDIRAQPRTLLREGGGESNTLEELQRELDNLDGLSIEELSEGDTLLPKLNLPVPGPEPIRELPDDGN